MIVIKRAPAVALALIVVISAACTTPTASAPSASAAASATPRSGGTVVVGTSGAAPAALDMVTSSSDGHFKIAVNVYEQLLQRSPTGAATPGLAEKIDIASDGLTYTMTLRTGVKFHDGTDFDATAVKFNFDVRKSTATFRGNTLMTSLREVKVVDAKTVQLVLSAPQASLLEVLGLPLFAMQSPAAMTKYPGIEYRLHAAGTGPFKLGNEQPSDSRVTLIRNDQYWGPKAYLDTLVFRNIADPSARVAALEAGDTQFSYGLNGAEYQRVANEGKLSVYTAPTPQGIHMVFFNMGNSLFKDKRVRQAVAYGLNTDSYLPTGFGLNAPAYSPVWPSMDGYVKETRLPYDPAKAKQMLADAGVPQGTAILLVFPGGAGTYEAFTPLVKQDLDKMGFVTTLRGLEGATLFSTVGQSATTATWQLAILTSGVEFADAADLLQRFWLSGADAPKGFNWSHYINPQFDELYTKQATIADRAARNQVIAQMQQTIWDDLPSYILMAQLTAAASSKSLHDVIDPWTFNSARFGRAWLAN
jgi:ABC-type transport system substrate-binding protein